MCGYHIADNAKSYGGDAANAHGRYQLPQYKLPQGFGKPGGYHGRNPDECTPKQEPFPVTAISFVAPVCG